MRIVHTVSSIESESSGLSYAVPRLCHSLAALGHDVDLLSLGEPSSARTGVYCDRRFGRDLASFGPLRKLGASAAMRNAIASSKADILHTHGLWMMPNVYPANIAQQRGRPFLLSLHGMLGKEALQFSRLKKQLFWAFSQRWAVRLVSCFHATAEQEYGDIRAFGLKQPVAIIPNGIDLPALLPRVPQGNSVAPFVLSLGRLHPVKALDQLIRAWALVAPNFPRWRLRIVGPDEGNYATKLTQLVSDLKLTSVDFSDAVFGESKIALLAGAELFVLSSLHENFAMTVAESLAVGTPVISTKGAPWSGLNSNRCGWWVEHGPESLASALSTAMALSQSERRTMGERGHAWMKRDFAWDGIARQMEEVYRWLIQGGESPASVRVA